MTSRKATSCSLITSNVPYDLVTCPIVEGTVLVGGDRKWVSENIYTEYVLAKHLLGIYKELLQFNKKTTVQVLEALLQKICKWAISIWSHGEVPTTARRAKINPL